MSLVSNFVKLSGGRVMQKDNPNHGADGKFSSGGGGDEGPVNKDNDKVLVRQGFSHMGNTKNAQGEMQSHYQHPDRESHEVVTSKDGSYTYDGGEGKNSGNGPKELAGHIKSNKPDDYD